jgi:ribosomal protein S18 acetylase RimI-like enzyme
MIGHIYLFRNQNEIHVMDIGFLLAKRGQGIGSRLLNAVLRIATQDEVDVTLQVEPNNPARRWYERLGFRMVEDRGVYLFMDWRAPSAATSD